jgi:CelD/BcsL family acetyltransferase involved in cellulose biosynthesis
MLKQKITIEHIKNLQEFKELQYEWDVLLNTRLQKTVFLTWEWLYTWWKHNEKNKALWLLTARHGNQLVGVAPLILRKEKKYGLRFRLLESLGSLNTDESDFMVSKGFEECYPLFFDYIFSQKHKWDAIKLNELNAEINSTSLIKTHIAELNLVSEAIVNQHHHIPTTSGWDDYVNVLSKNTRDSIKKRLKNAKRDFQFEFRYQRGEQVTWNDFESIFQINENGNFPEKYRDEKEVAFHKDLFELTKNKNWVEIIFIFLDNQPVAFDFGFNMDGRFEGWRTGYDLNFKNQAVGKLLLFLSLEFQFKHGYSDYDFLRGQHDYKSQWNPLSRDFVTLIAVQPWHLRAWLALIIFPKLWKWIKKNILRRELD